MHPLLEKILTDRCLKTQIQPSLNNFIALLKCQNPIDRNFQAFNSIKQETITINEYNIETINFKIETTYPTENGIVKLEQPNFNFEKVNIVNVDLPF